MLYFFFSVTATTEIYTLSLHDALPILGGFRRAARRCERAPVACVVAGEPPERGDERSRSARCLQRGAAEGDRKSTRLNSSHGSISYAVFCLKKKKTQRHHGNADDIRRA